MWLQDCVPTKHVLKRDWVVCLEYDKHSHLNNQKSNWEDLDDHSMSTSLFNFEIE